MTEIARPAARPPAITATTSTCASCVPKYDDDAQAQLCIYVSATAAAAAAARDTVVAVHPYEYARRTYAACCVSRSPDI